MWDANARQLKWPDFIKYFAFNEQTSQQKSDFSSKVHRDYYTVKLKFDAFLTVLRISCFNDY